MKNYLVQRGGSESGIDTVDVILETKKGFEFICECGDWDNESAQEYAKKICALLNASIMNVG